MKQLKKSLGQNFFNNPTLADKIISFVVEKKPSQIIEIGPGDGYFTSRLIKHCQNVTLIEKDNQLVGLLSIKFPNVRTINSDILSVDLNTLIKENNTIVFGSLPYNISKEIIRKLLEETDIKEFFFIIQKEVAQKYANEKPLSIQYLTTKIFADTKILLNINPGSFIPKPKVDSSFVYIKRRDLDKITNKKIYFEFIKNAFKQPRKTLRNNLKNWKYIDLISSELLNLRAQELSFEKILEIVKSLEVI